MSFFKNRHVVVATLMAPLLGLGAYFGMGFIFGERPQPAETGQSYKLVEKPNCRYASGLCGLKNVDFELTAHCQIQSFGHAGVELKDL